MCDRLMATGGAFSITRMLHALTEYQYRVDNPRMDPAAPVADGMSKPVLRTGPVDLTVESGRATPEVLVYSIASQPAPA